MITSEIQAIDVHGHFGRCDRPDRPLVTQFMSGDAATVVERARATNTRLTVVSPLRALMPRGNYDVVGGNNEAARVVAEHDGLLQWVVIDPREPRSFEQADAMLRSPKCVGIKIHPEEHLYPIVEFGEALFAFAAERRAVILTHSGEPNSLPEDFIPFANDFGPVSLILAHLGHGHDNDPSHQVRAIKAAKRDNVFVDTSSARSIMPGLIEWAVKEVGPQKILYGTDTPLYFAPMQRARIDQAEISNEAKAQILRGNAISLLRLDRKLMHPIAAGVSSR